MSTGHLSPQSGLPPLSQKVINTTTWGAGGTTCTITDEYIHPNSDVDVKVTGSTPPAGFWSFTTNQGSITITSSQSEGSTLALSYVVY